MYGKEYYFIKAELVMMPIISVLALLIKNNKTSQAVAYFLKTFTFVTRTCLCSLIITTLLVENWAHFSVSLSLVIDQLKGLEGKLADRRQSTQLSLCFPAVPHVLMTTRSRSSTVQDNSCSWCVLHVSSPWILGICIH